MITVQRLRKELKLPVSAKNEQELLDLRQEVIDSWERETARLWQRRVDHVETFIAVSDTVRSLFLELAPVESIFLIEEKLRSSTSWSVVPATSYELLRKDSNEIVRRFGYWKEEIRVTYTGGYVLEPATVTPPTPAQAKTPAHIVKALALQAKFINAVGASDKITVKSQNFESGSGVMHDPTLHPYFAAMAEKEKRIA